MYVPDKVEASGELTSGNYGGKNYKLYVPSSYDGTEEIPLMVMLHGCSQDANQFIASTKMNTLSDQEGFLVLYPEQNSAANPSKCWNWFEPAHQKRESGELSVIAGMVQKIKTDYTVKEEQVYVSGFSAGGAMSVLLGATYPDVFAGVAVAAGLEYKAATSMMGGVLAMTNGGPDPVLQGREAQKAFALASHEEQLPVIVFHGTSDYTVRPINGEQVTKQWTVTNSLVASGTVDGWMDAQPDWIENLQVPNGKGYTIYDYHNNDGDTWVRKVIVDGMGHAWSGGSVSGTYVDAAGPDATAMIWDFFKLHAGETPLRTTASPAGGVYYESVSVELTPNKEATTYYTTDGTDPTEDSSVYTEPITIRENTVLKFFSVDTAGVKENVKEEEYTISTEPIKEGLTLSSIGAEDGYVGRYTIDGISNGVIKVGDKGMYNLDTYRGLLSFETSSIDVPISSATLRLYPKVVQGNISSVQIDMMSGVFGNHAVLEQVDYSYRATESNIAAFPVEDVPYVEVQIPSSMINYLNNAGKTQFRLKGITSAGFTSNYVEFYGGENEEFAPRLILNTN